MNAVASNFAFPARGRSGWVWLAVFLSPTLFMALLMVLGALAPDLKLPGLVWVFLVVGVFLAALFFCEARIVLATASLLPKVCWSLVTVIGMAVQFIVDVIGFGLLAFSRNGFEGVF